MSKFHQFHMVKESPWPITASISALSNTLTMMLMMSFKNKLMSLSALASTFMVAIQWWRDILRESSLEGNHSSKVMNGLKIGMILFIASEVMFFFSFFWAFFHSATCPISEIGNYWPPKGIQPFNPLGIPLLNTFLLISSGMTITWSHHEIMKNNKKKGEVALILTISLGMYFSLLQGMEYWQAEFSMSDSVYGSTFFMATGFHGLHVIIGTIFLWTNVKQMKFMTPSSKHFFGFEAAAWYWHFVDVVWLFLYSTIYWWGV